MFLHWSCLGSTRPLGITVLCPLVHWALCWWLCLFLQRSGSGDSLWMPLTGMCEGWLYVNGFLAFIFHFVSLRCGLMSILTKPVLLLIWWNNSVVAHGNLLLQLRHINQVFLLTPLQVPQTVTTLLCNYVGLRLIKAWLEALVGSLRPLARIWHQFIRFYRLTTTNLLLVIWKQPFVSFTTFILHTAMVFITHHWSRTPFTLLCTFRIARTLRPTLMPNPHLLPIFLRLHCKATHVGSLRPVQLFVMSLSSCSSNAVAWAEASSSNRAALLLGLLRIRNEPCLGHVRLKSVHTMKFLNC